MKKIELEKLEKEREVLAGSLEQMVDATKLLLKPLTKLSDEQRNAVAILGLLLHGMLLARRPANRTSTVLLNRCKEVIDEICPPLGRVVIEKDPCF